MGPATAADAEPRDTAFRQLELTHHLEELFELAVANAGALERAYRIADLPVRIRFGGPAMLERVGPVLRHLECDLEGDPLLTLHIWDSATTRTPKPPLPRADPHGPKGAKYYFADGPVQVCYQPGSASLDVFDGTRNFGWYWSEDPKLTPGWEAASPLDQILHWWFTEHGVVQVHAGAVGTEASGGVLVVGRSGSGKSTTCLSSVGHPELRYVSDDYAAVRVDPEPWAYSLYNSGRLQPDHAERLPHLASAVVNGHRTNVEDKVVFYVNEHFPESVVAGFPLRAVLAPRIAHGQVETRFVEMSPAAALAALAPSTFLQLHPPTQGTFHAMAQLVARVPCYRVELGSDIAAIPQAILDLLAGLEA